MAQMTQRRWTSRTVRLSLTVILTLLLSTQAESAPLKQFSPPAEIKLEMYALRDDGSINFRDYSDPHCSSTGGTQLAYGCTWYDGRDAVGNREEIYPFSNHEIEIGYEGEMRNGFQQGYLHNVVPHEIAIEVSSQDNKALSALQAQAIAARTFAYYETFAPLDPDVTKRIDNSATKQVYIPFRYDALSIAQQQRVGGAVAGGYYMTLPGGLLPIQAHYGMDNDEWTASYLKSVYDPINAAYGLDKGTGWGGMSSKGASRWGFGHTSSWGPVARDDPNYPHDINGDGDFWSASYDHAVQILTHYYTGIHLRDASDAIVTPAYRWLPLKVDWESGLFEPPEIMLPGESYTITSLVLQNAGAVDWGDNIELVYYWLRGGNLVGAPVAVDVHNLVQGAGDETSRIENLAVQSPAELRIGDNATLIFDLRNTDDPPGVYLSGREAQDGKPWFALKYDVCIGGECHLYLPLVLRNHFICPEGSELIQNGDFEQGTSLWVEQAPAPIIRSTLPITPYSGEWAAWLGGYNSADDTLYQAFTVPPGMTSATVHFYVVMETAETLPVYFDHFYARLRDSDGRLLAELYALHNTAQEYVWFYVTAEVSGFEALVGQTVRLSFETSTDSIDVTNFVLDDVSLVMHCSVAEAAPSGSVIITVQPVERVAPKLGPVPTKSVPSLPVMNP